MKATTKLFIAGFVLSVFATPALADWKDVSKTVQNGSAPQIERALSDESNPWRGAPSAKAKSRSDPDQEILSALMLNCRDRDEKCVSKIADWFKASGIRLNFQSIRTISLELGLNFTSSEMKLLSYPWKWGPKNKLKQVAKDCASEVMEGHLSPRHLNDRWKNITLLKALKQDHTSVLFEGLDKMNIGPH